MNEQNDFLELRKTLDFEGVKTYYVYDGTNRIIAKYEIGIQGSNGDKCLRTRFEYRSVGSTQIAKRDESIEAWDSSWEI